jgi:hypothetical protein
MAFQASSQVTATQKEQVRNKFAELLTMNESKFAKLFNNKAEKHQVSAWNAGSNAVMAWRVPLLQTNGGDYQAISLDSGDMGTGSMLSTNYMTFGYFANDLAYGIPALAIMATKTNQQAMNNTLKQSLGRAVKELVLYNEIGMFQDNTGILATANGTGSPALNTPATGQFQYNLETSQFADFRIRGFNQLVDVYDASNVLRAKNCRVYALNLSLSAPTITLTNGSGAGTLANTNVIAFPGMSAGTVDSSTIAAGSWRNGIYTFSTTATTGTIGGADRAVIYELICCQVNGSSGFYTPSLIFSGRTQQVKRRDEEALTNVIGVCSMAQRVSWYLQGITIANQYLRPGESAKSLDLAGQGLKYGDTFEAGDVTHHISRYAQKNRVDWIKPDDWGWLQLDEMDFFRTPEGQRIFVGRSSSTGNPLAAFQFYQLNTRQLYNVDPGINCVFSSLALPAGQ